jgi:hypothetical protein
MEPTMASIISSKFYRLVLPLALPALAGLYGNHAAAAGTCTLTWFDSVVDFGAMRPPPGSQEKEFKPSPMRRSFAAACPEPAQMSVVFQGQPKGSNSMQFGEKGSYAVRVVSARLDGETVQMARLLAAGMPPSEAPSGDLALLPSDVFAPVNGQQLLSGKRLDVTLEIAPVIPADAIRINQKVELDATAQLRLIAH